MSERAGQPEVDVARKVGAPVVRSEPDAYDTLRDALTRPATSVKGFASSHEETSYMGEPPPTEAADLAPRRSEFCAPLSLLIERKL